MTLSLLVQQFLRDDCTPDVRKLICEAVKEKYPKRSNDHFEFNRFGLSIDYEAGSVTIADGLDVEPSGQTVLAISQFMELLGCDSIR